MNQCPRCLKPIDSEWNVHTCTPTDGWRKMEAHYDMTLAENYRMRAFIRTLLDPEVHGHAMTKEIRNAARSALGMDVVK